MAERWEPDPEGYAARRHAKLPDCRNCGGPQLVIDWLDLGNGREQVGTYGCADPTCVEPDGLAPG